MKLFIIRNFNDFIPNGKKKLLVHIYKTKHLIFVWFKYLVFKPILLMLDMVANW